MEDFKAVVSASTLQGYSEKFALAQYIKKVSEFPILSEEEERFLLKDFFENQNNAAGHAVLNSHLRLVVSLAMQYKRYHNSIMELIAEGNLGLLKALKNFNLEKGVRFATYAMLWIKASIREFLIKSISSIKIGTTAVQKKILFNLSKARKLLGMEAENTKIAKLLNVEVEDIAEHENMMHAVKETSLNEMQFEEEGLEKGDYISNGESLEEIAIQKNSESLLKEKIENALTKLPKREAEIVKARILTPEKYTLSELSNKFGVSKERIRQIQENALKRLKLLLETEK